MAAQVLQKERFRLLVNRNPPDATETPAANKGKSIMEGHEKFYVIEGGMMKKLIVVACLLLTGCAPIFTFHPEQAGPYPDNYKEIIRAHIERTFFDPYSLRSVRISNPHEGVFATTSGYRVCLEANAKNRMGGYIGLRRLTYLINSGQVVSSMDGGYICDNPPYNDYAPWPEMEGK